MSLIRPVLRMCAVGALRGNTWAENRVYDSDNTPLVDALTTETKPYITVFTDTDTRLEIEGMDVYSTRRDIALVFEFGIASAIEVTGTDAKKIQIPQTDAAMEALLDMMEGQIVAAVIGDPQSKFGEIIRLMVNRVMRMPSRRGGSADKSARWAARQLSIVCQTIADPAPGQVLSVGHPIKLFIDLAGQPENASLNAAAEMIDAVLTTTAAPDWRLAQAWLGLTERGVRAMGIAPMPEGYEDAVQFEEGIPEWDEDLEVETPGPEAQ